MALPDPNQSRVVLIGASRFTDAALAPLPAVLNNVADLAACFRDPDLWGLPKANCIVVTDPETPDDLLDPVHNAAEAAEDTLLVYYAGHGQIDPDTNELLLALTKSKSGRSHTSARYEYLRRDVKGARARRRVVILDCCYSGKATGGMADLTTAVADEASAQGTYLMASAPPNKQALSPPGEIHTAFTGELIGLLTSGLPGGEELLDLDAIYRHIFFALRDKSRPEPQKRAGNTAGDLALARNRRWPGTHRPATPVTITAPQPDPDRETEQRAVVNTRRRTKRSEDRARAVREKAEHEEAEHAHHKDVRERIKAMVRDNGMQLTYSCPVCGVKVTGQNLVRHYDKHSAAETRSFDPAKLTLTKRASVRKPAATPVRKEAEPGTSHQKLVLSELLHGRYQLGEVIGRGEHAEVRVAMDNRLNRKVAVKLLLAPPSIEMQHAVGKAVNLDHPGIVRIFDTMMVGQSLYIVMEFVDGRPLDEILRSHGPAEPIRAAEIMVDVCDALIHGNQHHLRHGNLIPRNVMLQHTGKVKLLNFGFTPGDLKGDIFAAGRLLYELITGTSLGSGLVPSPMVSRVPLELHKIIVSATNRRGPCYLGLADMHADLTRVLAREGH